MMSLFDLFPIVYNTLKQGGIQTVFLVFFSREDFANYYSCNSTEFPGGLLYEHISLQHIMAPKRQLKQ